MKIVDRLILTGFLRALLQALLGAIVLFTLLDLFDHLGSFLDNDASALVIGRYYLAKIPWIVDTTLPIASLMATLFTVGGMARYNELLALFAAGRSLLQVTRPLLLAAVCLAGVSLLWSEYVLPEGNRRVEHIWEVEVHHRPDRVRPTTDVPLQGADGRLYYARRYDPAHRTITGFRALRRDGERIAERYDAQRAVWRDGTWVLHDVILRRFDGDRVAVSRRDSLVSGLHGITPADFARDRVKPEAMNVRQLLRHIALLERSGADATRYRVDLQFKFAFPWVHLIVVMLGILLASGPRKTTVAGGFGWTVLISFGYYLAINFGRAMGHTGVLPPFVAAWIGNALYLAVAAALYVRVGR